MAGLRPRLVLASSFGFLVFFASSFGFLVVLAVLLSSLGFLVVLVVAARFTGLLAFLPLEVEARFTEAFLTGLARAVDALWAVFLGVLLALEVLRRAGGLLDTAFRLVDRRVSLALTVLTGAALGFVALFLVVFFGVFCRGVTAHLGVFFGVGFLGVGFLAERLGVAVRFGVGFFADLFGVGFTFSGGDESLDSVHVYFLTTGGALGASFSSSTEGISSSSISPTTATSASFSDSTASTG